VEPRAGPGSGPAPARPARLAAVTAPTIRAAARRVYLAGRDVLQQSPAASRRFALHPEGCAYGYLWHPFVSTWRSERAVEVPIAASRGGIVALDRSWPDPIVGVGALLENPEVIGVADQRSRVARKTHDREAGEDRVYGAALEAELAKSDREQPVTTPRLATRSR
jgi:hypothetical protein